MEAVVSCYLTPVNYQNVLNYRLFRESRREMVCELLLRKDTDALKDGVFKIFRIYDFNIT
jgi:hypothetical protein